MQDLQDVVTALPVNEQQLRITDPTVRALSLHDDVPSGYVWPNVEEIEIAPCPRILIIIAAGAVGKSAAAAAVSAKLKWPLIDAAKARVGSYSLSGLLHDALGFESDYMSRVASGHAGVIIDALDEGHLRAGTSNFYEFLENVRKLSGSGHDKSTIVLLSRPDTAEIIKLYLSESTVPFSVLRLAFFSHHQACSFLSARLDSLHSLHPSRHYSIARQHPTAYARLRDLRLLEIAQALLSRSNTNLEEAWAEVAEFLGYAPVLSVLAEYLAVPNPHSEVSKPLNESVRPHEILLQIVDEILSREQLKFKAQVVDKLLAQLPADANDWLQAEQAYSPDEQSLRLLARQHSADMVVPIPSTLPVSLRQQYEQDASQFTADHPFLSGLSAVNIVFSDFLLAKAAVDRLCLIALKPNVSVVSDAVGPFFYRFVASFSPTTDDSQPSIVPVVPEKLVPTLLESYSQAQIDVGGGIFVYAQAKDSAHLLFARVDVNARSAGKPEVEFAVADLSGVTTFPSRLAHGIVVTDGGVSLGERGKRFFLGPFVTLSCAELDIEATHLSVDATEGGALGGCVIRSPEVRVLGNLSVDAPIPDRFTIFGKVEWPALRPFVSKAERPYDVVTEASYVDLRAVMKSFRQQAGSLPSVYRELLEQRVIKNNQTRAGFLRQLIQLKVVHLKASHYYLDTRRLSSHGVNWHAIVDGVPSNAVLAFIVKLRADDGKDSR